MNADRLLVHYEQLADASVAVPCLRRFTRELAVRGKLVPQDPTDEPASELLKRIAEAKAQLVKTDQIRIRGEPTVTIDEPPFPIPTTWRWVRFGNIVDFSAGRTPARNEPSYWNSGDHAWVSIADMEDGETLTATKETVSKKAAKHVFRTESEKIDTIIMSFKLTIGKIARLGIPAYHNEAIISIRPHLSEFDPYLFVVLPHFARQGNTKGAMKGATLNRSSISNILIPLPPLAEQHRIVAKVDELMALCDRMEAARTERETMRNRLVAASLARLNAPDPDATTFQNHAAFALGNLTPFTTRPDQIKALRQTILNLATCGKLVEQDPNDEPASELLKRIAEVKSGFVSRGRNRRTLANNSEGTDNSFGLPITWKWCRLGDIALEMRYGTARKCHYDIKGTPVLRIPNISGGKLDLSNMKFGNLTSKEDWELALRCGDLLVVRSNGSLDLVGRAAEVDETAVGMSFAGYLVRVRLSPVDLVSAYVLRALNADHVRNQIEKPIRSTVGLKNVNSTELAALTIPLPPLAEQHRIVAKVDQLMSLCDRLEESLATVGDTRRRLLDAVLHDALALGTEPKAAAGRPGYASGVGQRI